MGWSEQYWEEARADFERLMAERRTAEERLRPDPQLVTDATSGAEASQPAGWTPDSLREDLGSDRGSRVRGGRSSEEA